MHSTPHNNRHNASLISLCNLSCVPSASDGTSNPLRNHSHPPLLYIMIVHYFRSLDPLPPSDPFILPNPHPHSRLPSDRVSPHPIYYALAFPSSPSSAESCRLDSTARQGAELIHIHLDALSSRCNAHTNLFSPLHKIQCLTNGCCFFLFTFTHPSLPPHHSTITCFFNHSHVIPWSSLSFLALLDTSGF